MGASSSISRRGAQRITSLWPFWPGDQGGLDKVSVGYWEPSAVIGEVGGLYSNAALVLRKSVIERPCADARRDTEYWRMAAALSSTPLRISATELPRRPCPLGVGNSEPSRQTCSLRRIDTFTFVEGWGDGGYSEIGIWETARGGTALVRAEVGAVEAERQMKLAQLTL